VASLLVRRFHPATGEGATTERARRNLVSSPGLPIEGTGLRRSDLDGGLSLVFIHVRFMASPEVHVLSSGLFSVKQSQKALPIGTRIAGDKPGFHRR